MSKFAGAGPDPGRIQPPRDYRDVLREKGITLPLSDTKTSAYVLGHQDGEMYCPTGIENLHQLCLVVWEFATEVQTADLSKILDLHALKASVENHERDPYRPSFVKRELTLANEQPEKWISIRQMLEDNGVDVAQLVSRPRLADIAKTISELAATGSFDTGLSKLEPPKIFRIPVAPPGPYGLGSKGLKPGTD